MLPDLSPTHILIVVVVALVVVGPKDLPMLLRKIGQFMGKMRGMANEFRASFDEMARQSELDELRKEVEAMRASAQAAVPQDFGVEKALNSQAEGDYMAEWQASQAAADPFLPGFPGDNVMMPLTSVDKAPEAPEDGAKGAKPKSAKAKAPKAEKASDSEADAPKATAKPRAKKAKPAEPSNPEADA